uniref:Peroxisome proliferator-activated receptor alpha a n=1 Tax=Hucho hucho TaxID=62062 RepID=A0A4W5KTN2_9TELE
MVDMPGSYSPLSPLGKFLLGRPLCGDLIIDMEDTWTEDISHIGNDTLSSFDLSENSMPWVCMCVFLCGHVRPFYHGHANTHTHPLHLLRPDRQLARMGGRQGFFRRTIRLKFEYDKSIRFGRMPQSDGGERGGRRPQAGGPRTLVRQIHKAYMKNFNMNKAKAWVILTGKICTPPFVIHDMESPAGGVGPDGAGSGPEELQEREAEARLFHCSQCFSVETVTELTEFTKSVTGFQCLDLNDQYEVYEALFTLLASCMNIDGLLVVSGGGFITREVFKSLQWPFSDMMEPKFQFAWRFNSLELDDSDLVLF